MPLEVKQSLIWKVSKVVQNPQQNVGMVVFLHCITALWKVALQKQTKQWFYMNVAEYS